MRRTDDGWVSVYDYMKAQEVLLKPQTAWNKICDEFPELKGYSEVIQLTNENPNGVKTPTRTPCLHENALVLLDQAIKQLQGAKVSKPKLAITPTPAPVVEIQQPQPAETAVPAFAVIAGKRFVDAAELEGYLKDLLKQTPEGSYLSGFAFIFMVDLISRHPFAKRSLINGLYGVKVVQKPGHGYKNFALDTPGRLQTISIVNYLSPAPKPAFAINVLQKAS